MAAPNIVQTDMSFNAFYPVEGAGVGKKHLYLPVVLAGLAGTAKVIDNYLFGCNGRVVQIDYLSIIPASTAAKLATITPSVGGTNLTGGVLDLTTAKCTAGAVVPSTTAISAGNSFGPTTPFDLTLSSVTAFVEGSGVIDVTYYNDDERACMAKQGLIFPS